MHLLTRPPSARRSCSPSASARFRNPLQVIVVMPVGLPRSINVRPPVPVPTDPWPLPQLAASPGLKLACIHSPVPAAASRG